MDAPLLVKGNPNTGQSVQQTASAYQSSDPCPRSECWRCHQVVKPCRDTVPDYRTHLVAALLFIIGLPFFCFLPYCIDLFGKTVDRCPRCGAYISH